MVERCPTCGFRFEREPGFFIGAYFVNLAITEGLLFAVVIGFLFAKNADNDVGVFWPLVIGGLFAVVTPLVFYPWSRTIWSAIDLAMTPLELEEIVAAEDATEASAIEHEAGGPEGGPLTSDEGAAEPAPHGRAEQPQPGCAERTSSTLPEPLRRWPRCRR